VGPAIADAMTGYYAAFGILGALFERQRTNQGRRVDVSMFEAMAHFNLDAFTHLFSVGEVMGPYSRPSVSQSYVLECACGGWIALHMSSPEKFWQGLATAMERPDIFEDERFCDRPSRIANQDALIEILRDIFKRRSRAEWCERLVAEDVPHAPMYRTDEVPHDAQARHLQLFVDTNHPVMGPSRTVRSPISFDGERSLHVEAPPTLGEHNAVYANGWPNAAPAESLSVPVDSTHNRRQA
jgi:crotonobetainyl-CoA:carnitine CoA-transferase CaiB-like acyl-CoA transferase